MSNEFNDFGLRPELVEPLDAAGYTEATPIQKQALPILLGGQDLIGVAETGTGKTLAFLLPIFQGTRVGDRGPQAMVICPTRELAIQVGGEAQRFGAGMGVRTVLAYGGTSSGEQKRQLTEGCELIVGTPGRLLDFVTSAWLSLRALRFLVLDEADRMLDMGFINDVDAILRRSPMSRQTMLFSATFPEEVRRLADRYMLHPEIVRMHTGTQVTANVDHAFYPVHSSQRDQLLFRLLEQQRPDKALIFTATREGTSELARALRRRRYDVASLSSLLSQANRERVLDAFRRGECPILVATDVAARGLDITDINLVVNYDVPMQPEDYVHRIGRTGRAASTGKAVTLVTELDSRRAGQIEHLLKLKVPRVRIDDFEYKPVPERRSGAGDSRRRGGGGRGRPGERGRGSAGSGGGSGKRRPRKSRG